MSNDETKHPAPAQDAREVVAKHLEAAEKYMAWAYCGDTPETIADRGGYHETTAALARSSLALRALLATTRDDSVARLVEAAERAIADKVALRGREGRVMSWEQYAAYQDTYEPSGLAGASTRSIGALESALAAHRASIDALGAGRGEADGIQFAAQLDEIHAVGAEARHKGEPKDAPKHLNSVERFAWELGWDYGCKVRERNVCEKERDEAKANAVAFRSQRDSAINEADAAHGRCETLRQERDLAIAERDEARKERDEYRDAAKRWEDRAFAAGAQRDALGADRLPFAEAYNAAEKRKWEADRDALAAEVATLRAKIAQHNVWHSENVNEVSRLAAKVAALKADLNSERLHFDAAQRAYQGALNRAVTAESRLAEVAPVVEAAIRQADAHVPDMGAIEASVYECACGDTEEAVRAMLGARAGREAAR